MAKTQKTRQKKKKAIIYSRENPKCAGVEGGNSLFFQASSLSSKCSHMNINSMYSHRNDNKGLWLGRACAHVCAQVLTPVCRHVHRGWGMEQERELNHNATSQEVAI